jgi:3-oxoacyl-[acyl-carrier protein] reductase
MAEAALTKWGRIDALVNNAGTTKVAFNHADLSALSAADFQHVYGVNVVGAFQMIRAVEPAMRKQGGGAVVNVSSIAAVMGIGTSVAYAASKGALNTMTLSLARALGPQIRINAVCPGFVETRWLQEALGPAYEGAKARYMSNAALQKVCTPDDIARAVLWLLEGSELVTGEFILVDGGAHLGGSPTKAR